ncbi:NAD-dependent epimerase/dehydratase family protein [Nocardioides sp. CER19]|uniref:SDR family oxidoreductase n=1 Tax=Nocardioides sp. CER19 TaxID=3038538 RepID=UPI0024488493|nr:NAD-dependent epimerase/dehydratase family protein [Nocardioides sp. CER19]MDH2414424.1 NAD-dependent epimerase/dehydratase family protein [Nocardioides sp. CER19]
MKIAVAGSTGLIGSQVTALAREAGHEVVGIARQTGFDLLAPVGLTDALVGVEALIDVTQSPSLDEAEATEFFETVAANLGTAATKAGVRRTVVLSIVGADKSPDYGYYVAKVAQEEAVRRSAPGPVVLRATQFHEFAGQMLEWNRDGAVTRIIDVPTQPVASAEIARLLVDLATAETAVDTDLAGPQQEGLVDQVRRLVELRGDDLRVEAVAAPASMAGGSMLPGPDAVIRGPRWDEWVAAQQS